MRTATPSPNLNMFGLLPTLGMPLLTIPWIQMKQQHPRCPMRLPHEITRQNCPTDFYSSSTEPNLASTAIVFPSKRAQGTFSHSNRLLRQI